MTFRKRALVALTLAVAMLGTGVTPAKANYDSERSRAGASQWAATAPDTELRITFDRNAGNVDYYRVRWSLYMNCQTTGAYNYAGNAPNSHRGLEWDAAFPPYSIDTMAFDANGTTHTVTGMSGDEGFYLDTPFLDGSTKRMGWGVTNPENLDRCVNGTSDNTIVVSIWMAGPATATSGLAIVWKLNAMTEDPDFPCVPSMAFCMFGDFHHTIGKTGFNATVSTPGTTVAVFAARTNRIFSLHSTRIQNYWAYHLPSNGYDCLSDDVNADFCYDAGYYTGGDATTGDGPPGDWDDVSMRFGDIEGDNLVAVTHDIAAPGGGWTADSDKKAYATAEVATKCVTPKTGRSNCLVTFGYEGVADSDPSETRFANLTIPSDGNWYLCRVDVNHTATTKFTYGHDDYRWKIITDDRWLAIDNAFIGNKTEYALNNPGDNMFAVNQCTNIGA